MPKSILWILCAIAVCIPNAIVHGQSATQSTTQETTQSADKMWMRLANNGAWWNTLSQNSKADFVDGYVSAMVYVHQIMIGLIKQDTNALTPGPKFDGQMSQILGLSVLAEHYEFEEVGRTKLLTGMDVFYKEPLNKQIPIDNAFQFERDTLNGKVAPRDLQKQLDEWRATMNK